MIQLVERQQRYELDQRYLAAKETLTHVVEIAGKFFLNKPGVFSNEKISNPTDYMLDKPEGHISTSFQSEMKPNTLQNFRFLLQIAPNRTHDSRNYTHYQRGIVLPNEKLDLDLSKVDSSMLGFHAEPQEFLVASEIFPIAYHGANSMGLRARIDYSHWRSDLYHRIGIHIDGRFGDERWQGVLDLVRRVDYLIDEKTSSEH